MKFEELSKANRARVGQFKNKQGGNAHRGQGLHEWNVAEWGCAMAGEAGEACNIAKKIRRGDFAEGTELQYAIDKLAEELADTVIYCDLMAQRVGLDLGSEVRAKFNRKSRELGLKVLIP